MYSFLIFLLTVGLARVTGISVSACPTYTGRCIVTVASHLSVVYRSITVLSDTL